MVGIHITGLGAVSHVGNSVPELIDALFRPRLPVVSTPDLGGAQVPIGRFAVMPERQVSAEPTRIGGFAVGPSTRAALAATREALTDAEVAQSDSVRLGVVLGSSNGDAYLLEQERSKRDGPASQWIPTFSAAQMVASEIGARGPAVSVSNACAGSGYAVATAVGMIESGAADVIVAGGYETFSRVAMGVFNQVGAVTAGDCVPFSADRSGTTLGEAAAVIVLESEASVQRRRARSLGEIGGQGWSCDAYHATGLDPTGDQLVRAMCDAMADAGVTPAELAFIVPHGTGTRVNDEVESQAMARALAPHTDRIPVYSSKALLGHTAGASGALSLIAAVTFLGRGVMAPNLPIAQLDPVVRFPVPTSETAVAGAAAMVNTYAFGGNNMSLIVRRGQHVEE